MKRLVLQTYIEDTIERDTKNTYKKYPKLERLSKQQFKRYAHAIGADYELFTGDSVHNTAHWGRMVMFDRPEYDEILYVDCDILIHPQRYTDNIFDVAGSFVEKMWHNCIRLPNGEVQLIDIRPHPSGDFNAGVMKLNREELDAMRPHINEYYHPTHNQASLNACYRDHVGEWEKLPYRFNVTHKPTNDVTFRHYAGMHKQAANLKQCRIWRHYK